MYLTEVFADSVFGRSWHNAYDYTESVLETRTDNPTKIL
jgi:hypothetical protein